MDSFTANFHLRNVIALAVGAFLVVESFSIHFAQAAFVGPSSPIRCCRSSRLKQIQNQQSSPMHPGLPFNSSPSSSLVLKAAASPVKERPAVNARTGSSLKPKQRTKLVPISKSATGQHGADSNVRYRQPDRGVIKKQLKDGQVPISYTPGKHGETDSNLIRDELQRLVTAQGQHESSMGTTRGNPGLPKLGRSIPAFASKRPSDSSINNNKRRIATASNVASNPDTATFSAVPGTARSADSASASNEDNNEASAPSTGDDDLTSTSTRKTRQYTNNKQNYPDIDLQRYYRTELLTVEEEFILGDRVQFMIACEEVHEGLAFRLARLPTLGEWGAACGYTQPPTNSDSKNKKPKKSTMITPADVELFRPTGCEKMFEAVDPHMFVGNGLTGDAGPGRGRGRARKIPHVRIKDRRADSTIPPPPTSYDEGVVGGKESSVPRGIVDATACSKPVNRGTVRDFLDMLQSGHEAKQAMIQSNMRLVVSIARKYMNVGVSLNDLVQDGSLGLSRAAEKFDPRRGFKFSTYASWWIQQAVFRSIAYQSRNIRLPVHIHNMLNRIHRVRKILTKDYGRAPSNEEMASQLGMSLHKYNKLLRLTKRSISLDIAKYASNPKDFGHEGDDRLGDSIDAAAPLVGGGGELLDESAPERMVDHTLFLDDLKDMLQILDEDERLVLCARYGLTDGFTRTVTAVAAHMKQSKAWVRSQECRALRKLRRPWYEKKLKEHESSLNSY